MHYLSESQYYTYVGIINAQTKHLLTKRELLIQTDAHLDSLFGAKNWDLV